MNIQISGLPENQKIKSINFNIVFDDSNIDTNTTVIIEPELKKTTVKDSKTEEIEVIKLKGELDKLSPSDRNKIFEILGLATPGVVENIIKVLFNLYIDEPTLTEKFKKHAVIGAVKGMLNSPEFDEIIKFLKEE